jgi:hypothetical protein
MDLKNFQLKNSSLDSNFRISNENFKLKKFNLNDLVNKQIIFIFVDIFNFNLYINRSMIFERNMKEEQENSKLNKNIYTK